VWRELKKLGAVYLRYGVALLPARRDLEERLGGMLVRIESYGGTADLIAAVTFPPPREAKLIRSFVEDRTAELREVHHACARFLRDVLDEVDAKDFGFPDVDKLETELGRLERWFEQICKRDYFDSPGVTAVKDIRDKCRRAFEQFAATAVAKEESPTTRHEDAFEKLSTRAPQGSTDHPL